MEPPWMKEGLSVGLEVEWGAEEMECWTACDGKTSCEHLKDSEPPGLVSAEEL